MTFLKPKNKKSDSLPSVFDYLDHRQFLRDWLSDAKKKWPKYSYRFIAPKIGFKSAGLLSQIIQGKTKLSEPFAQKFSDFMALSKAENQYFLVLVRYVDAPSWEERKFAYQKMISLRPSGADRLNRSQFEYFDKWYYIALRELLNITGNAREPEHLAKLLRPPVTPAQVRKSIKLLKRLELIEENENGSVALTKKQVTSGYKSISPIPVTAFQLAMIELAGRAAKEIPADQRTLSTITCSVSRQGWDAIVERLAAVRREIQEIVRTDVNVDRVCQINIQQFPLSDSLTEAKK